MKTFFELLEDMGMVEKQHYVHDKNENRLFFDNWSEIIFTWLDDISKVKWLELWFLYVDEVDEVPTNVFSVLSRRLRNKHAKIRKAFITSNSEWKNRTYQRFIMGRGVKPEYRDKYYTVRASSLENKNLPQDYIDDLLSYEWDEFKRYVLGDFNVFEWQIFDEFDETIHVVDPFDIPEWRDTWYWHDHWLANPTVFLEWHMDYDWNMRITWEHYLAGKEVSFHANALNKRVLVLNEKYGKSLDPNNISTISDPSIFANTRQPTPEKPYVSSVADEYAEHGINCERGNNSVLAGINRIKYLLKNKKIFVFSTCSKFIEEMNSYRWKTDQNKQLWATEAPVKKDDHSVDAFRYLIMTKSPPPEMARNYWYWSIQDMVQDDIRIMKEWWEEQLQESF